jgi:hypothetical protein
MIQIKCQWVACKYNSGFCDIKDYTKSDDLGECKFNGLVVLQGAMCDECGSEDTALSCENFESKVWDDDGNLI